MAKTVSILIPCRNEEAHLRRTLDSLARQDYPLGNLEVLVVDGESEDRTADIARAAASELPVEVKVLTNQHRRTPHALNIGLRAAKGDVIGLIGAHSSPAPDYVTRCLALLELTGAACVGGRLITVGDSASARAIAAAQSSLFGVGNARFRTGVERPTAVDTAAFGLYRREVFDEVGEFDEQLLRNQDDELNFRLTQAGHTIWLEPAAEIHYVSRATVRGLWRQYFEYGYYKALVLRKRGALPAPRQLAPPAFVAAVVASVVLAATRRRAPLGLLTLVYAAGSTAAGWRLNAAPVKFSVACFTMHAAYGIGFYAGSWRFLLKEPLAARRGPRT